MFVVRKKINSFRASWIHNGMKRTHLIFRNFTLVKFFALRKQRVENGGRKNESIPFTSDEYRTKSGHEGVLPFFQKNGFLNPRKRRSFPVANGRCTWQRRYALQNLPFSFFIAIEITLPRSGPTPVRFISITTNKNAHH